MDDSAYWCEVTPLGDLLVRGALLAPDRDGLVFPDLRRTYAELLAGARRVARGLLALGVGPGDHVGLLAANSPEYVEGVFGASLLGAVVIPMNVRHRATELRYIITNGDVVALLTHAREDAYIDFPRLLTSALPSLGYAADPAALELEEAPALRCAALMAGSARPGFLDGAQFGALADEVEPASVEAARLGVRVRDPAIILYTSGTTANPKGCVLSHEAMMRGATYRARVRLATREHDVTWGAGPLFHVGSLAPFIGSLGAVGTYLTDYFFEPGRALDLMVAEGVTIAWPWFPAIMQPLIDHPRFDPAALPDLRSLFLIGPRSLIEQVQAMFPKAELVAACGMTETAGIYALSTPDETVEERAGAQGKAAAGVEVRVIHPETGDDLPAGEIGEILVRGYCVMEGYYRDPVNTEKAIDADRWLHTGDLYSVTPDGRLVFHGRVKDMLKVGGENVAVIEVESFLCRHPDVNLAEVVGMPDDRLDEVPVAFVELRAGSTTEAEELIDFCRGQIASYKVPRRIFFVGPDEWPMSLTKIDKRRLRARVADALAVR